MGIDANPLYLSNGFATFTTLLTLLRGIRPRKCMRCRRRRARDQPVCRFPLHGLPLFLVSDIRLKARVPWTVRSDSSTSSYI